MNYKELAKKLRALGCHEIPRRSGGSHRKWFNPTLGKGTLDEVLDFVQFLQTKTLKERLSTAIASESSLKKDWMKPEEDEAWQNL